MNIITILATITGIVLGIANVPQAYKIFARKSAKDISPITYTMLIAGSIVWTIYGIYITNMPLIIGNGIGTIVSVTVIIGWLKYK